MLRSGMAGHFGRGASAAIFLLLLAVLAPNAGAEALYSGYLEISLDAGPFNAGGEVSGKFIVTNSEAISFNDGKIIAEIVSGNRNSLGYPSQLSDAGVIISEKAFDAPLLSGQNKEIPFSISLPENLSSGTYTLDAYYRTGRTPIIGIAHIFISPVSAEFELAGSGDGPTINIVRTKTVFNGVAGPVGPPTEPGSTIAGKVFLLNPSSSDAQGIEVFAGLCPWDDTACASFISQDSKQLSVPAGGEADVGISLKVPSLPGAYAIRIEARKDGKMLALYRNRAIVTGGTARIRKFDISAPELNAGQQATLKLLLGSSPDHYTFPSFDSFSLNAWVEAGGKKIFEKTEQVASMPFEEVERGFSFSFAPAQDYKTFTVCSSVTKNSVEFDKYCFDVVPLEKTIGDAKGRIEVETNYSRESSILSVSICGVGVDGNPESLDVGYTLLNSNSSEKLRESEVKGETCFSDAVPVSAGKYLLIAEDLKNGSQFNKTIDISATPLSCIGEGKVLCQNPESCDGEAFQTDDGLCCSGKCALEKAPGSIKETGETAQEPALLVILLAAAVILVFVVVFFFSGKRGSDSQ